MALPRPNLICIVVFVVFFSVACLGQQPCSLLEDTGFVEFYVGEPRPDGYVLYNFTWSIPPVLAGGNIPYNLTYCVKSFPKTGTRAPQCEMEAQSDRVSLNVFMTAVDNDCRRHFFLEYSTAQCPPTPVEQIEQKTRLMGCIGRKCPSICFMEGSTRVILRDINDRPATTPAV